MLDLHVHTRFSDGTDTVEELLINAENKNLEIISITDHDTTQAYNYLEKEYIRNLFSGRIIVGVEMKAYYNGVPVEVLGYGIDYNKIKLHKTDVYIMQIKFLEEFKKIGKRIGLIFDENISVSKTDPSRKFASVVFATELLKYKENENSLLSIGPRFDANSFYRVHSSNKNSIFYVDESEGGIPLNQAIGEIHNAGGLAFLAHPLVYPFDNKNKFEEIEEILKNYDLDGLECEYPLFSNDEREHLKKIAIKYNKYISGGTDYHAKNKPNIQIGTGINENLNIEKELIENWLHKVKLI